MRTLTIKLQSMELEEANNSTGNQSSLVKQRRVLSQSFSRPNQSPSSNKAGFEDTIKTKMSQTLVDIITNSKFEGGLKGKMSGTILDIMNYSKSQSFSGKAGKQSFAATWKATLPPEEDIEKKKL